MARVRGLPVSRHALAVIATCLDPTIGTAARATDTTERIVVDGKSRTYTFHRPDLSPPPSGFPIVLAFHGGGRGVRMRRLSDLDTLAATRRFIAVYPDGTDGHWNDGRVTIRDIQDDIGFTAALSDDIETKVSVDRGRVYSTGLSHGALFTHRLACNPSTRIASVAGTLPADLASRCRPDHPVALLQIGGTVDPVMTFDGGRVADFRGRGEDGGVLSVAETAASWARRKGRGDPGTEEARLPRTPGDPTRISRIRHTRCPAYGAVIVPEVVGGGHTWSGGPQFAPVALVGAVSHQLDASLAIVDFHLSIPPRR